MKFLQKSHKKMLAYFFAVFLFMVQLSVVIPAPVQAQGIDTFTWTNFTTVTVTSTNLPSNPRLTSSPQTPNNLQNNDIRHRTNCRVGLALAVDPNNSAVGTLRGIPAPPEATAPGDRALPLCSDQIRNSFNRQVNIGGNRTPAVETDAQKTVTVAVGSGTVASQAPGAITITLKDKNGNDLQPPRQVPQQPYPGEEATSPGERGAHYQTAFIVNPGDGDYKMCITGLLEACYDFHKVAYTPLILVYGENFNTRVVNVNVQATYTRPVSQVTVAGPMEITLTGADGQVKTVQTNSVTSGPRNDDEAGASALATTTATLLASFSDVAPGKYKICVSGINQCQDIEKVADKPLAVTFDVRGNNVQAASLVGNEEQETNLCPDKLKEWVFSWAACPLVTGVQSAISTIRVWVYKQLLADTAGIFGNNAGSTPYYAVWNSFRVLAVALIIIFGIVMVASEALGFGIFNAYTIRKVLPRLLIMAIFIALSWWIFLFVVTFFNNLTVWIYTAVLRPFSLSADPLNAVALGAQFLAIIVAAAVINPMIILSYVGTLLLAFLVASLIFAIRQIAIVLLVVTAPIWLACYVLAGTQKIAKIATGGFISLMLMGPAFGLIQAAADVVMLTATDKTDPTGLIRVGSAVVGVLALTVIFMKLGGMAATLTGTLNDRGRGAFDRLKNGRRKQAAGNLSAMAQGTRWSGRNSFTNALNRTTSGAVTAARTGLPYNPADWRRRYSEGRAGQTRQAAVDVAKEPRWATISQDDEALRAGTYRSRDAAIKGLTERYMASGKSPQDAERDAKDAVARFEATGVRIGTRGSQFAAAQGLVATGTGYKDIRDELQTFSRVSNGDKSALTALAAETSFVAQTKGRYDLAPKADQLIGLSLQQLDYDNAQYDSLDAEGNKIRNGQVVARAVTDVQTDQAIIEGAERVPTYSTVQGKTVAVENTVAAQARQLNIAQNAYENAMVSGDPVARENADQELRRVVGGIQSMRDNRVFGSSTNAEALYGKAGIGPGRVPEQRTMTDVQQRQLAEQAAARGPSQDKGTPVRFE